jgi:hypothetical protein
MLSRARAWGQANAWINLVFAVGWAFLAIGNVFWGQQWWFTVVLAIGAVLFVAQWFVATSGREPRDSPSLYLVAAVGCVILVIVVLVEGPWWLAVVFGVSAVVAAVESFHARRRLHGHA